jgi:hypothetical protein
MKIVGLSGAVARDQQAVVFPVDAALPSRTKSVTDKVVNEVAADSSANNSSNVSFCIVTPHALSRRYVRLWQRQFGSRR